MKNRTDIFDYRDNKLYIRGIPAVRDQDWSSSRTVFFFVDSGSGKKYVVKQDARPDGTRCGLQTRAEIRLLRDKIEARDRKFFPRILAYYEGMKSWHVTPFYKNADKHIEDTPIQDVLKRYDLFDQDKDSGRNWFWVPQLRRPIIIDFGMCGISDWQNDLYGRLKFYE